MTDKEKLKAIRLKLGFNQIGFAESLKMTQGAYSKLETGGNDITEQLKLLICLRHNVNSEYWEDENADMLGPNNSSSNEEIETMKQDLAYFKEYCEVLERRVEALNALLDTFRVKTNQNEGKKLRKLPGNSSIQEADK